MKLTSEESAQETSLTSKDQVTMSSQNLQFYDEFTLQIKNFKIGYYNSLDEFENRNKNSFEKSFIKMKLNEIKTPSKFSQTKRKKKAYRPFKILKKLEISINCRLLKEQLSSYTEKPQISLKIHLGNIVFGLHSSIILKLKSLVKSFNENIENSQDLLLFEKKNLLENATKLGIMRRFFSDKQLTERRFVILSDMYLYFFEGPDKAIYESYYYLREASLEYEDTVITLINNQNEKIILICEDKDSMEEWVEVLMRVIEKSRKTKENKESAKGIGGTTMDNSLVKLEVKMEMKEFKLNLYDSEHILWLGVSLVDVMGKFSKKTMEFEAGIEIGRFIVNSMDSDPNLPPELRFILSNVPFETVYLSNFRINRLNLLVNFKRKTGCFF